MQIHLTHYTSEDVNSANLSTKNLHNAILKYFLDTFSHYSRRVYLITTAEFRVFFLKWVQFYVHTLLTSFIAACMHHETLNENIFQK